jgi:hypothetical protein
MREDSLSALIGDGQDQTNAGLIQCMWLADSSPQKNIKPKLTPTPKSGGH